MGRKRFLLFKVFGIFFLIQNCFAQFNIIPQPNQITPTLGHFYLTKNTKIIADKELLGEKFLLKEVLSPATGFSFDTKKSDKVIRLKISKKETNANPESYELEVLENKITISSPSKIGIVWGIQSLRLLFGSDIFREAKIDKNWQIPCLKISDSPKYGYRGFMLDCSRTFISKNEIKKYIKVMSLFKMNTLHLHLTDDQGWRIEIKKYPQLTEKASKYAPEITEPAEYQGYYSQDDLKELVAFAAKWNIEIIPEIEMPGHSLAVFAAFPDLSCKGDSSLVKPWSKNMGLTKQIYCAGNDQTFTFIEQVLTETMSIFPSQYIHIGGDEAPKEHWKECPKCQKRIKDEGLKDEAELQSWFIKRIELFLSKNGKKMIGWDEIMEGGVSPTATIMHWRSWHKKASEEIQGLNNDIILTPTSFAYLDSDPEKIKLEKVYNTDLKIYDSLNIKGIQACFWSHLARTSIKMNEQIFPRFIAISEKAWSGNKDFTDFLTRLNSTYSVLDNLGIYYSVFEKNTLKK